MTIKIGKKVPAWTLEATGEKTIQSKELLGQNIVLYFYPRDNTPGCTTEAQDCLLYTSPSPRDQRGSRMPSSA